DDAAQGRRRAAGDRRAVCRDQGATARLLRGRLRRPRRGARHRPRAHGRQSRARLLRDPPHRPLSSLDTSDMTDIVWLDQALASARPQVVAALLRYFRDLDAAEEAFQDACLRALKNWPKNGPPRDPAAWLIFVGRNAAIDTVRRQSRLQPLADVHVLSDTRDESG